MAAPSPPTGPAIFLLVLLIFASGNFRASSLSEMSTSSSSSDDGSRSLLAASRRRSDPSLRQEEADCGNMASGPGCRAKPSCRWCLSNDVDDMCFSKSESLRLPPQIFSCES